MTEKVVLAFSKDETAEKIKNMLYGSGYEVVRVCHSRAELIRCISQMDEILVIMGYKLRDAMADEVYEDMLEGQKLIAIVKADMQENVENPEILTIPLPLTRQHLISAVDLFWGAVERRSKGGSRPDEEKKIINNAKRFLMETYMMSEEQAHRFIQKRSMDTGAKLIDTAKMILNI